ncbi:MAG TPA: hypothetical protein VMN82_12435 [Thermoanaerobaculia bacterium]|nr:hypothetical protein [Thermoanaerobaculia bacterium]
MSAERLIALSWYRDQATAQEELGKLREAGLEPSVRGEYGRLDQPVEILVPESQFEAACARLGIRPEDASEAAFGPEVPPEPTPETRIFACPECRSGDTSKVPSYGGRALMAALVVMGVSAGFGKPEIGGVAIGLWMVAVVFLARHAGRYRCRNCGWEFRPENA